MLHISQCKTGEISMFSCDGFSEYFNNVNEFLEYYGDNLLEYEYNMTPDFRKSMKKELKKCYQKYHKIKILVLTKNTYSKQMFKFKKFLIHDKDKIIYKRLKMEIEFMLAIEKIKDIDPDLIILFNYKDNRLDISKLNEFKIIKVYSNGYKCKKNEKIYYFMNNWEIIKNMIKKEIYNDFKEANSK